MAASTDSMCFLSDSLAVYSCMSASASAREGSDIRVERLSEALERVNRTSRSAPVHLRTIAKAKATAEEAERFPFSVPIVRELETLSVNAAVTFLVGEKGAGEATRSEEGRVGEEGRDG